MKRAAISMLLLGQHKPRDSHFLKLELNGSGLLKSHLPRKGYKEAEPAKCLTVSSPQGNRAIITLLLLLVSFKRPGKEEVFGSKPKSSLKV